MNERAIKLLDYLGLDETTEVKESKYDDNTFIVENEEYMVLTDEEADDAHYNYIENFIDDCGIGGFTPYGQEYIIENCMDKSWFDDAMQESYESYVDDIRHESAMNDEFENRLEEEMSEADCEDEDSFVEHLCSMYEDGVEWYRHNFGDKDFFDVAKERCSVDIQAISEFCIREDGRGHSLSHYDGHELELEDDYYAYRIG